MTRFHITCTRCQVTRDLGEFYATAKTVGTIDQAHVLAGMLTEKYSFHMALLASFMWDHRGHECVMRNSNFDAIVPNDTDFWDDGITDGHGDGDYD